MTVAKDNLKTKEKEKEILKENDEKTNKEKILK